MTEEEEILEKKFLHDLSNYLFVAQGMGSFIDKVIKENFESDSKECKRSSSAVNAVNQMVDLIKERRDQVIGDDT